MLTNKIFLEQIKRLEAAFNHKLPGGGYQLWWFELKRSGVTDKGLTMGVSHLIDNGGNFIPSLSSLMQASHMKARKTQEDLAREKRHEQEKRDDKDWLENAGKKGGQIAKDCTDLLRKLINEQIEPGEQYYNEMMKLEKKYPGIGFKRRAKVYADGHKRFQKAKERGIECS